MRRGFPWAAWVVVMAASLSAVMLAPARAEAPQESGIQDNGDFFSPQAVAAAKDMIAHIGERFGRDVLVVTYPNIPEKRRPEEASKGKDRFFADWLNEVGRSHHVDGIVILVVDKPGHVQVGVKDELLKHDFTVKDRDELRDRILAAFRHHDFDRGLVEGVRFVLQRMEENQQPGAAHFHESPTTRPATQPTTQEH